MSGRVLTRRELNRATLARQLLLERADLPAVRAVERVAGLQAQLPAPPFVGLWTRLRGFRREDLAEPIARGDLVRATLMRCTLHLVSAADYRLLRPPLQPALERTLRGFHGPRLGGLDVERVVAAARTRLQEGPRSFADLRPALSPLEPDRMPETLAFVVRAHLPLVQVPNGSAWCYSGTQAYALTDDWPDGPVPTGGDPRAVVLRHLAAFGPASARDVAAWSGLTGLGPVIAGLRPELRIDRDEGGAELLDLPDAPRPPADAPAPPRLLPEYDNVILAHADRSRIIAPRHRPRVFLSAGRVRATFLLDGEVAGTWRVEGRRGARELTLEPFSRLPARDRDALAAEAEDLLGLLGETDAAPRVRIARPG